MRIKKGYESNEQKKIYFMAVISLNADAIRYV